ncbi:PD-(D/E)XK nuclease family protein [Chondrinema litorale]|uniref:PD-(D/E)XK nuclease family protein n=1 Tax=Chondrinema litorale TaxID=2994555 RepID=UPI00254463E0|nr:PD-(D/E)XK nuclease family protein [Chondrinema litorale]UZR94793.1 PD-(D/E)XK nuclease family protein [Chondrinema litorale]
MIQPFLKKVAEDLYNRFGNQIGDTFVILPSRRACMYFRYYLAEIASKNLLAPEIMSMDDFIGKVCDYQIVDRVSLLFELYQTYKKFDKDEQHNLEKFIPLGGAMLNDFGMIDKNLNQKKAEELFEYLEEVKAMERWAQELGAPPELKENSTLKEYFAFWTYLRDTYKQFRKDLLARNSCYSGLAYRLVYDKLDNIFEEEQIHHIAFAGFNQLTVIEEDILKKLQNSGKATLYWDSDEFYLNNKRHEAGDYLRKFTKSWLKDISKFQHQSIENNPIEIDIIHVNNNVTQAKLVGDLISQTLEEIKAQNTQKTFLRSMNHTAVLLPDESLLQPLLHSLPYQNDFGVDLGKCVNITMGMSMQQNPIYDLIDAIFRMQENVKPDANDPDNFRIYHKDLLKIIQHPFVKFFGEFKEAHQKVQNSIQSENMIYISRKWLMEHSEIHPGYAVIFQYWEKDTSVAIEYFYQFIEYFSALFSEDTEALESQFLFQFYTTLKRLDDILQKNNEKISLRTFRQFVYELVKNVKVPFTGEPITPIQIMGMLESRTLDFENVIILSCNEGLLPQGKTTDSIIPFDLRVKNNMPTHQENDASFAYTFYRLFHQAKKITLIYTEPSGSTGGGEKSRFLNQIEEEFGYYNLQKGENRQVIFNQLQATEGPKGIICKQQLTMQLPEKGKQDRLVKKDDKIIELIRERLKKGVSPSAINMYIASPLNFFHRSVLRLDEITEIEEDLNHRTFGTLMHETIDELLKDSIGKQVDAQLLETIAKDEKLVNAVMESVISKKIGKIVSEQGKNFLLRRVAERLLQQFMLQQAESAAPFLLVDQESFYKHYIKVSIPFGEPVVLCISGKADRIDILNKEIRIVDYKTGNFNPAKLKVGNVTELFYEPEKEKIVQLLLYKYILIKNLKAGKIRNLPSDFNLNTYKVTSGFYFFRKMKSDFVKYALQDEPDDLNEFCEMTEGFLKDFVIDVMDPENPFTEKPSVFKHIKQE